MYIRQSAQLDIYTPDQSYHHFLKSTEYAADFGDGSCMLYVITLKEFNHTLCEALDLDLKGQVQGWS